MSKLTRAGLPMSAAALSVRSGGGAQDLQALHRRGVPALGVRPLVPVSSARGRAARARRAGLAQGRPRRRRRGPQWRSPAGRARPPTTAGQVLYRVAEMLEGRRAQFAAEVAAAEGLTSRRPGPPSTPRSTGGSTTPAGPTSSPRSSARPTRSPGRTSPSRCPSRPASSACSPRRTPRLLGLVSVLAPVLATGNTAVVIAAEDRPLPAVSLSRGAGHLGRPRRRGQPAHRLHRRAGALAGRTPRRERHRPHRRRRRRPRRPAARPPPTTSSASTYRARRTGPPPRTCPACAPSSRPRPSGIPSESDRRRVPLRSPEAGTRAPLSA